MPSIEFVSKWEEFAKVRENDALSLEIGVELIIVHILLTSHNHMSHLASKVCASGVCGFFCQLTLKAERTGHLVIGSMGHEESRFLVGRGLGRLQCA